MRADESEADDTVRAACQGWISGLLHDLRHGNAAAREIATQEITIREYREYRARAVSLD